MNLRKLVLAGTAVAALLGAPAQASIVDNPQFRVLGLVIVWGADSATGSTPVVSDFIINDSVGAGDTDLIAGDVHAVVTGTLTPLVPGTAFTGTVGVEGTSNNASITNGVLDASESLTAFTLTDTTDVDLDGDLEQTSSFYVASNTNFSISGEAQLDPSSDAFALSDVGFEMTLAPAGVATTNGGLTFGEDSQDPGGTFESVPTLADMGPNTLIYDGTAGQRTAATRGSIADQSVRFDATYTLGGAAGYDLSLGAGTLTANVEYTVFVP